MQVLAYDKFPYSNLEKDGVRYAELDELLANSDVISLHCPLTEETNHMINAVAIDKCKKGVVIINTSRGALVDSEALLNGIKTRKVGAACLDVYEEESDLFFECKVDSYVKTWVLFEHLDRFREPRSHSQHFNRLCDAVLVYVDACLVDRVERTHIVDSDYKFLCLG